MDTNKNTGFYSWGAQGLKCEMTKTFNCQLHYMNIESLESNTSMYTCVKLNISVAMSGSDPQANNPDPDPQ